MEDELCKRCGIRRTIRTKSGCGVSEAVRDRVNELLAVGDDAETGKPCLACMGVLQRANETVGKCLGKLRDKEYDVVDFELQLSIPIACSIREEILECKNIGFGASIKQVLREMIDASIGEADDLKQVDLNPRSELKLQVEFFHDQASSEEAEFLQRLSDNTTSGQSQKSRKRKQQENGLTMVVFEKLMKETRVVDSIREWIPKELSQSCIIAKVDLIRRESYVVGRYLKLSREISQTPWKIDGEQKGKSSVEEYICEPLRKLFRADRSKFHASGREDIDVRMLGNGRPFVCVLQNARRLHVPVGEMEFCVNENSDKDVEVRGLKIGDKDKYRCVLEGESTKTKQYACIIWVSKRIAHQAQLMPLNFTTDLNIEQKTPLRVLHRRPLLVRNKIIHSSHAERINDHWFVLHLKTSAGTYVKEFVHGDRGRTKPSVGTLLQCEADIIQLDVEDVELQL